MSTALESNVPKKVLRPDIIITGDKELLSYIEKHGPQMLKDWISKYDNDRERFPRYYKYIIGRCLKKFDLGFQFSTRDFNGKEELRSFALLSESAIESLEISIDLIIGEPEDYPKLLEAIIGQYDGGEHYNIYTYIPYNSIFMVIFMNARFEIEDEFYGGLRENRLKFIKVVYKLTPYKIST